MTVIATTDLIAELDAAKSLLDFAASGRLVSFGRLPPQPSGRGGLMAFGDRKADRVHLEHRYPVNLMGVDGTWRRKCVLLDVSSTGAKLEVEGTLEVLGNQEFFLLLSSTGLAFRRCELIRVDGTEVGVRFVTEKRKKGRAVIPQ